MRVMGLVSLSVKKGISLLVKDISEGFGFFQSL